MNDMNDGVNKQTVLVYLAPDIKEAAMIKS
jgi:hypothetical protein